jgi:C-terminal processing protease CtpA/Prc
MHHVIDAAAKNLRQHYAYPDVGKKMADSLLAHERAGDDDAAADGVAFADLLTKQMRDVSHDRHLELAYSEDPLPASRFDAQGRPLGQTPDDHARYRKIMEQENCAFEKTEILAHNIGYLKLNAFPDPSVCRPTAVTAMASLNHVDAIIFDLRNNRGGEPEMVALMAAYLFDRPEYWYNPRENTTRRSWTQSPVPGNRLADKPVYVLTSNRTSSGAEQFSYDLKMLKRAILVGETTGGAAHSGVFYRIDDHFGIGIPETKPINPFSETDWAETGVKPDVMVNAADALETAVKLAESKQQKK